MFKPSHLEKRTFTGRNFLIVWPQQLICVFLLEIIGKSLFQVVWDAEVVGEWEIIPQLKADLIVGDTENGGMPFTTYNV